MLHISSLICVSKQKLTLENEQANWNFTEMFIACEVKFDILVKKLINNHFKQPFEGQLRFLLSCY